MEFYEGELLGEQDHVHYRGYRSASANDKSVRNWKRFAFLPNVEGQKYTIGNIFTSREEQGELIFWFGVGVEQDTWSKIKRNSFCEITIVENQYWIKPLMGNSIWVNDVVIETPTRIDFGDYISFGERKYWGKVWAKEPSPVRFLFKKRELAEIVSVINLPESPAGGSAWDNSGTSLAQNSLLISIILSYIPAQKLKQFRFVSRVWNEEAAKLVKKEYQFHFTLDDGDWGFDGSTKSMKLFRYSVDMKDCLLQNWKITSPSWKHQYSIKGLDYSAGKPGAKILSDLEWFLLPQNLGHSIRRLELDGEIFYTKDLDVRTKILESLKSTLQELVLSGQWNNYHYPSNEITFPKFNFEKLERVTLKAEGLDSQQAQSWMQSLIPSIRRVRALHFRRRDDGTAVFLQNRDSFPNLEEISFDETTPRDIRLLLGLEKPLKKIQLRRIQYMEPEDVENFEKLLQYQSNTLESLLFDMPLLHEERSQFVLFFPVMPKLVHLSLGLLHGQPSHYYRHGIGLSILHRNRVNYKDFPNLQSLALRDVFGNTPIPEMNKFWEKNEPFYDIFFPPKSSQICGTLRYLEIPFEDESHHVFPRAAQVAAMFPNVHNPWINEARKN